MSSEALAKIRRATVEAEIEALDATDAEAWAAETFGAPAALVASAETEADLYAWKVAQLRNMVSGLAEWDGELHAAWLRAKALAAIRRSEVDEEALIALAVAGVSDSMLEEAIAEAGDNARQPLAVEPEDGYGVRLARLQAMRAGALAWDHESAMRYLRAVTVRNFRGIELYDFDLSAFACLDDPTIEADYVKAQEVLRPRVDALIAGGRAKADFEREMRALSARALAASGRPAISASALPDVDPTVDEVVQIDAHAMLVRRGDVVEVFAGRFE